MRGGFDAVRAMNEAWNRLVEPALGLGVPPAQQAEAAVIATARAAGALAAEAAREMPAAEEPAALMRCAMRIAREASRAAAVAQLALDLGMSCGRAWEAFGAAYLSGAPSLAAAKVLSVAAERSGAGGSAAARLMGFLSVLSGAAHNPAPSFEEFEGAAWGLLRAAQELLMVDSQGAQVALDLIRSAGGSPR